MNRTQPPVVGYMSSTPGLAGSRLRIRCCIRPSIDRGAGSRSTSQIGNTRTAGSTLRPLASTLARSTAIPLDPYPPGAPLWSGRPACIRAIKQGENCSRDGRTTTSRRPADVFAPISQSRSPRVRFWEVPDILTGCSLHVRR